MPVTTVAFHGRNGYELAGYRWDPAKSPSAAVQIVHGMGEHALRYAPFAEELTAAGFVVYAYDHRGHGASAAGDPGDLGPDGWAALVAEIGLVGDQIRAQHPGLRLGLVAHSMGSFATQQFLLTGSASLDAVALTGTAAIDLLEPALDLDAPLELSAFNAAFQPQRTDFDWLSRDEAVVDTYLADPLCGFGIDQDSARAMFAGSRPLADPAQVAGIRPDLPVYLAVGDHDPVNGGLALFEPLAERLRTAGLTDVTTRVYPGARHEILNETNRDEVTKDLLRWVNDRLI
ncbi:alpha/beta fold hydrolase [Nocardia alni]|uniref:alpha/beta fold hydrolase n=1 Tax=Nocardia alni TaxID=2815723 RepID=UPI001C22D6DB|nr:alpha/beta hydrolase [Nocardia alni]